MKRNSLNGIAFVILLFFGIVLVAILSVQSGLIDTSHKLEIIGPENTTGVPSVEASAHPGINGQKLEISIYQEVNKRRINSGTDRLILSNRVRLIARLHSKDMADQDYFNHTNPEGLGSSGRHKRYDGCNNPNENILYWEDIPYSNPNIVASMIVDSWANSPGHNKSMMTPYDHVTGVGVYVTENRTLYVTQDFCREHPNA